MRKYNLAWLIMLLFTLTFIPACGGGGGGDGGGGTVRPPVSINFDEFVDGDMGAYTKETFTFTISTDTFISVELYGARLDHADWTAATVNAPHVKLLDLSSTVGTPLATHNTNNPTWVFGLRDTEIPLYFLKKTTVTPTQTFSIEVTRQSPAASGGRYKLRVNNLNPDIASQFGGHQTENELRGQNTNSSVGLAETITPVSGFKDALIIGHYEDTTPSNQDFFLINIDTSVNPVIACFEIFAHRNGIWQSQLDYYDSELTFYAPTDAPLNSVDDSFFLDSQACQKVSVTGDYKLEVSKPITSGSASSSDYILKYTEESITNSQGETPSNDTPPLATEILDYGYLVNGSVNTGTDITDWFFISVTAGDMVNIRQFDFENSVDSTGTIKIEIFDPTGTVPVPFNGPAPIVKGGDGRLASLFADLTTTFFAQTTGDYRIKITPDLVTGPSARDYSFIVDLTKQATPESEPNDAPNGSEADFLSTEGKGFGEIGTAADIDFFELDPTDLSISPGDIIAVHVYATRDIDEKAFDITGFGSSLEPKITAYDNTVTTPIAVSTYNDDTSSDAASEGINAPYPTLTAIFEATSAPAYLFSIEGISSTTGPYLIEAVNLGQ